MEKYLKNLNTTKLPPKSEMSFAQRFDIKQIVFFSIAPVLCFILIKGYVASPHYDPMIFILGFVLMSIGILCTAAGYHRLYSHQSFKPHPLLEMFFLFFGPSALQNSAIKWANDHRRHHRYTEKKEDPYPIYKGFFYAHMFWPMDSEKKRYRTNMVKDLMDNKLLLWQHKNYKFLVILHTIIFPAIIGHIFFDSAIGGFAILGLLKALLIQQSSSCINSVGHCFGKKPYDKNSSATDSFINGILTFGEGYHNYHHRFPTDYRHGHRLLDWDPSKWFIKSMETLGLAKDLRQISKDRIEKCLKENIN